MCFYLVVKVLHFHILFRFVNIFVMLSRCWRDGRPIQNLGVWPSTLTCPICVLDQYNRYTLPNVSLGISFSTK